MKEKQINKQKMARAVKKVMDDNQAIWTPTTAIVTEHGLLGNSIIRVDALSVLQGKDNTGLAAEKLILKNALADKAMLVAGPLSAYARIHKLQPLLKKVDIVRTDITAAKDDIADDIATVIFEEAEAIDPAELTEVGIIPAMLNDLNTAIVAFKVSIPKPRAAESETERATRALGEEFKLLDGTFLNLDDLHEPFKETHLDYYDTYHIARKIIDVGVRRIGLIVKCLDAVSGAIVKGAEVYIAELGITLSTTKTGNARFFSLPPGSYTVTITHELYQPVTLNDVGIFEGKTTRFNLELIRA